MGWPRPAIFTSDAQTPEALTRTFSSPSPTTGSSHSLTRMPNGYLVQLPDFHGPVPAPLFFRALLRAPHGILSTAHVAREHQLVDPPASRPWENSAALTSRQFFSVSRTSATRSTARAATRAVPRFS